MGRQNRRGDAAVKGRLQSISLFVALIVICGGYSYYKIVEEPWIEQRKWSQAHGPISFVLPDLRSHSIISESDYRLVCIMERRENQTIEMCEREKFIEDAEARIPNAPEEYLKLTATIAEMNETSRDSYNMILAECSSEYVDSLAATIRCVSTSKSKKYY